MTNIEKHISNLHEFTNSIDFESNKLEEAQKFVPILKEILGLETLNAYVANISPKNFEFTRARKNENRGEQYLYHELEKISYPAVENITKHGRANLFYQPRFYCSDVPGTSLYEVRPFNDWVTTMKIKITKPKLTLLTVNANSKYIKKGKYINTEPDIAFNKFMSEKFVEKIPENKNYLYLPTAILTNLLIHSVDGIIYPSVASHLKGENVVLKTEIIDKYAEIIDLRVHESYDHKPNGDFKVKCLFQVSELTADGKIEWQKINCDGHTIDENIYSKIHNQI